MAAQHRSTAEGRVAFAKLCEKYWFPLYAFVRQSEHDVHRARDLTQSFFAKLMEKNYVGDADPKRGRFRTFLLASLSNFMANEWNREQAQKRGGGVQHLSLDFEKGDRWLGQEPGDSESPERLFERRWALSLLRQTLDRLREQFASSERYELFMELRQYLVPGETEAYADVASRAGMAEGALRVAVHRLRAQYREILREEIADTLSSTSDVDDEIGRLFEVFSS